MSGRTIRLGTFQGGLSAMLALDRLVESRLLVQANSGSGKSWAIRRLLEQTHGMVQQLVLDIEGEFHTLREKFDYVLVAKSGGDVAADTRTAALLARRLLELGVSAIIDLYELKAPERTKFVRLFLEALVESPKDLWHAVLVVVDEAHQFCPQHGEAESAAAIIDLMTRGRKRGLCGVLATQRLSKLHKDAAAEANVKLIGRSAMDIDMKRAADELGFTTVEQRTGLKKLAPGEFYAFGPGLSENEVRFVRVGDVETSHPKIGHRAAPVPPPREKLRKVLDKLADLPKEAEAEHATLAALKAENVRLKREASVKKFDPVRVREVEKEVLVPFVPTSLRAALRRFMDVARGVENSIQSIPETRIPGVLTKKEKQVSQVLAACVPHPGIEVHTDGMTGPEQRILDAIAWLNSVGNDEPEDVAVAFMAGYTVGGGAFQNPCGRLRGRGLVQYVQKGSGYKGIVLTDAGRGFAEVPDEVLTSEEMHRRVLERLPGPEAKLLKVLLDHYPNTLSDEQLANITGYTVGGGAFQNPKGRLRTLGLIEYPASRTSRARDILFTGMERAAR